MKTVRIIISGKVQGVYYRQSTKEKANALGVLGTVKNLSDGSVKVIATGGEHELEELTRWCRIGPSRAVVDDVTVEDIELKEFSGFTILR